MTDLRPPTIDPVAAARWACMPWSQSAWLHEEVGRRMEERLQWIRIEPASWADWGPLSGGIQAHQRVAARYPKAARHLVESTQPRAQQALATLGPGRWNPRHWLGPAVTAGEPGAASVQMVWSNMQLHLCADPLTLMQSWHRALAADGFLMFSALGPDTLRELRAVWAEAGWPAPCHEFTDMHDWGDLLVQSGFAEPVMDMERITLTFADGPRLLQELRGLGRNLHPARPAGLRGRAWRDRMTELVGRLGGRDASGPRELALTFEVIYGHAMRPRTMTHVKPESTVGLEDMRRMLRERKHTPGQT